MNIVITHGYSDSNKGDLAIVIATVETLQDILSDVNITLQSVYPLKDPEFKYHCRHIVKTGIKVEEGILPSPYVSSETHNIWRNILASGRLVKNFVLLKLAIIINLPLASLDTLREADLVIAKGGQYLYNDQGGIRGALYLWRMLKIIQFGANLGKPTVLLGHSIGPINGRCAEIMLRNTLKNVKKVVVRESITYEALHCLGLGEKTLMAPDMAFLIKPKKISLEENIFDKIDIIGCMGVTVVT